MLHITNPYWFNFLILSFEIKLEGIPVGANVKRETLKNFNEVT